VVDVVEPRIRELLQACPMMPATVVAERLEWPFSISGAAGSGERAAAGVFAARSCVRTAYLAGEIAQPDFWFPPIVLPVGVWADAHRSPATRVDHDHRLCPVGLGGAGPIRGAEDLYAGWWRLLEQLGAVPRVLVWDGEGAVGRSRARQSELTAACQGFRGPTPSLT
jgi:hypothetical protein